MSRSEILRWGGVPFALVVGAVAYVILHGVLRAVVNGVGGINPDGGLAQFLSVPLPAVAGAALCVALGTVCAPSYKRETTIALVAFVVGTAVVLGVPALLSGGEQHALLFACAGSAFGAYMSKEILHFHD